MRARGQRQRDSCWVRPDSPGQGGKEHGAAETKEKGKRKERKGREELKEHPGQLKTTLKKGSNRKHQVTGKTGSLECDATVLQPVSKSHSFVCVK